MSQVYSYLRFSSARQGTGSSIDRQLEYARRWAAANGMVLDESLTMRDEGLSAYHQRHVKAGALGVFLEAAQEGRIPAGSVLIVEGLDRLSRAEPILAQAQLAQIINADITVVTASDGKRYNREALKATPMDLVYSLLVMIRAHEESETKSKRVKAAIRRHCEAWDGGRQDLASRLGRHPRWLRFADGAWSIVPERQAAILRAIALFRAGWGNRRISDALIAEGLQLGDGPPNANQIYRTIRNPALIGVKLLELDGETYRMAGYYPALIGAAEFAELQALMDRRARSGTAAGKIPGILTGIGITYCGYCGSAMVANNVTTRTRKDGTLAEGNRRLLCSCRAARRECPMPATCAAGPVERAIMTWCSDQINLSALLHGQGSQAATLRKMLAGERRKLAEADGRLARLTEIMLAADAGDTPQAFVRKARELEAEREAAAAAVKATEQRLLAAGRNQTPAAAEAWAALRRGVEAMDYGARIQTRRLIAETFERIVIYSRGMSLDPAGQVVDVLLVAKGGGSRELVIDRKSGRLIEGASAQEWPPKGQ